MAGKKYMEIIARGGLPEGWRRDENGRLFDETGAQRGKNGCKLGGFVAETAGKPMSEERKLMLHEARRRAEAQRVAEGLPARKPRVVAPPSPSAERKPDELARLEPKAITELEKILDDEKATAAQKVAAAKLIIEHHRGRPTQQVNVDQVQRIEYVLAAHEPPPRLRLIED
jgi:hypothetical protein